ncbi:MAG: M56 family metallopeptidase [Odoribacter sp.]|nr:M56 family metallopeptidase [Odoribacter sp.]
MVEFTLDIYSLLRFCGLSALLLGVYYALYDRKACFLHCRCYLLFMILVAALVSVARLPVYDSGREIVLCPIEAVEAERSTGEMSEVPFQKETAGAIMENVLLATESGEVVSEEKSEGWRKWPVADVVYLIYGVVVFVFLLRWIVAVMGIFRLKRWGSCYFWEDIQVVRNNRVASPFSFFRVIYINRKLQGETLEVVLSHEKAHIEHKHYTDTLLIEMFCIFFWFNPFVWLVKKELKALHEFEADRSLLNRGLELSKYQNIIFNELMGYGPGIANGFHNSMIKKRFIMMKTVNPIRYGLLRKIVILPAMAGVMVLFAFTDKETVKERVWLPAMEDVKLGEITSVDNFIPTDNGRLIARPADFTLAPMPAEPCHSLKGDTLSQPSGVAAADSVKQKRMLPFKGREGFTFYPLSEEQIVVSLEPFEGREKIKYIVTDKDETRVTILVPVYYESNWVQFNKGFCMVDKASGDTYMLRSMTRGIELNKTYAVEGHKNRMVEFTMVFPPLQKGVKVVTLMQKYPEMGGSTPSNGSDSYFRDVRIADYLPPQDLERYYDREGRPKSERKVEYTVLRNDQIVVSGLPFESQTIIKTIETDKQETRLTVVVPIYYESNWVQFNKGFCIEDCRTGEVYKIRSLYRGIELNKTLVVKGQKGKMVEFTMIFPPLKKKVKRVNIYLKYPEEGVLAPSNGKGDWNWRGVKLSDYQTGNSQIYY